MKPLPNCLGCGIQLKRHHNKRCRLCFSERISKLLSGENHYRYKDGRKKPCVTCDKIIIAPYPRNCKSCHIKSMAGKIPENCKNTGRTRFKKGNIVWNKGLLGWNSGSKNPAWRGGITPLIMSIRTLEKYNQWRKSIFVRDDFKCVFCGESPSNKLEAHHVKRFKKIFDEFVDENKNLSPINDKEELIKLAINYEDFWKMEHGITLCEDCHDTTKKKLEVIA